MNYRSKNLSTIACYPYYPYFWYIVLEMPKLQVIVPTVIPCMLPRMARVGNWHMVGVAYPSQHWYVVPV
ncbi:MAG: hypothetical protein AB1480_03675 [Nitrospirota bacterium]